MGKALCGPVAVIGATLVAGCAAGYGAGAPGRSVGVIAHRGASAYAPENTLAAFALAQELGADWFELDCHLSRDGAVVVMHDAEVTRTTGAPGQVSALTLAELRDLDAGSWKDARFAGERIPTLGEALDLAQRLRLGVYIEIKSSGDDSYVMNMVLSRAEGGARLTPRLRRELVALARERRSANYELATKVIEEVRSRRMADEVVVQSFSPVICAIVAQEGRGLRVELLGGRDPKKPEGWMETLRWLELLNPAGFNVNLEAADPALLASCRAAGRTMAVWTVDEPEDMRRLAAWGVDAIITNKPDVCVQVLQEAGKRAP